MAIVALMMKKKLLLWKTLGNCSHSSQSKSIPTRPKTNSLSNFQPKCNLSPTTTTTTFLGVTIPDWTSSVHLQWPKNSPKPQHPKRMARRNPDEPLGAQGPPVGVRRRQGTVSNYTSRTIKESLITVVKKYHTEVKHHLQWTSWHCKL